MEQKQRKKNLGNTDNKKAIKLLQSRYIQNNQTLDFSTCEYMTDSLKPQDLTAIFDYIHHQNGTPAKSRVAHAQASVKADANIQIHKYNNIKSLILSNCHISNANIKQLARLHWPSLENLDLSYNTIQLKGLKTLFSDHKFQKLQKIQLQENSFKNEGFCYLYTQLKDNNIKHLDISRADIDFVLINQIPEVCILSKNLQYLNLSENIIGRKGAQILAKTYFPSLKTLILSGCSMGDSGAKILSKHSWKELQQLFIQENDIGYEGNSFLFHRITNVGNLKCIQVGNLDEIGNCEFDLEVMSFLHIAIYLGKNGSIALSNLNMDLYDDMTKIMDQKFKDNL